METELANFLVVLPRFVLPYIFGIYLFEWIVDKVKSAAGAV